ncbi:unnamed protein product [Absidia cylindrospora]
MIAAISPADYEETLSTLRYADQAKRIKNKPVVNEDPNARLIRELKEELQALRDTLMTYAPEEVEKIASQTSPRILGSKSTPRLGALSPTSKSLTATSTLSTAATSSTPSSNISPRPPSPTTPAKEISFSDAFGTTRKLTMTELVDQLKASQKLLDQMNQTWEEKLIKTQEIHCEREKALEAMGILLQRDNGMGIHTPKQIPHLVNLNEDPLMSECLMYQIKPGSTRVGRCENDAMDIRLSGPNIMDNHCYFENDNGLVTLFPTPGSMTMVNGMRTTDQKQLHNGYRIILGDYHVFRFNHPEEVRKERKRLSSDQQQQQNGVASSSSFGMVSSGRNSGMTDRSESIFSDRDSANYSINGPPEIVDWNFAKREAVLNYYYSTNNKFINGNIIGGGDYSKPASLLDDETMSRTTTSSVRFSNGSLPLSMGLMNDDINVKNGYRFSGSQLSIDTGIFSAPDGLSSSNIDAMDGTSDDFMDGASGLTKRYNAQLQLRRQKEEYEERIRLATLYHEQPSYIQDMEMKLQRVIEDMRCMMDNQKQAYESKIKRLSSKLPPDMLQSPLSPGAQSLASKVIKQWRRVRYVLMAEELLVHAVVLKEANIIAKDLGRDVSYQYIVVHDDAMISSRSFWEPDTADLQQSMTSLSGDKNYNSADSDELRHCDDDLDLRQSIKPCLGVQVIDRKHNAVYIWSLPEIKRRLKQMQNLYNFSDRPLSRDQFTWSDPFYQASCPRYSLIGLANVSIRNLSHQVPVESVVNVFDRNSGKVMGKLRLAITPIARSTMASSNRKHRGSASFMSTSIDSNHSSFSSLSAALQQQSPNSGKYTPALSPTFKSDEYNGSLLHVGQQQVFEIQILELSGLKETLFTQVHAQFCLSAFGNVQRHSSEDKLYATEPISGFGKGPLLFNYTQNMTTTITENTLKVIMDGGLTVEVYGQVRAEHMYDIIERNIQHQKEDAINDNGSTSNEIRHDIFSKDKCTTSGVINNGSATSLLSPPAHRKQLKFRPPIRSYTDDGLLFKERHHVVAYVQLCELGDDGEYSPVNVLAYSAQDPGCFYLRQGIQRRLKIIMVHDSGVQLPWKNVTGVTISNVSLFVDKDDSASTKPRNENECLSAIEATDNHQPIAIHLHQEQPLEFYPDGTCTLLAHGLWDSSLHDFVHLNRVTAPQHRIRATLAWQVTCDKSTEPLSFSMDLDMKIHNRDLVPPSNASSASSSSAILNYFSSAFIQQYHRMSYKLRGIFSVHLSPPLTRQVSQLWRLNTTNRYVRGEELLGPERGLRDVSLIQEYRQAAKQMLRRQQVETTQQALALMDQQQKRQNRRQQQQQQQLDTMMSRIGGANGDCESSTSSRNIDLLNKVIQLWSRRFGTQKEVFITQKPPYSSSLSTTATGLPSLPLNKEDTNDVKLAPKVQHVLPSATIVKKGYLWHPEHTKTDVWVKHWFVFRRPFIMVYEDQTEIDELAVINVSSVRVEHKADVEGSSQKPNVFAIYTTNNDYLFQAKNNTDMIDWITKVDQFYPVDNLES